LLSRLRFCFPAFIFIVSLLFASCRSAPQERPPGYLIAGIESYPLQLDPRYATDANSVRVGNLIYNALLRANEKGELRPELAETWRALDDLTYVFELRKNVAFHDGRPLTAADVKFTYESILAPESRSPKRGLLKPLRSVETIGPRRLKFRLASAHAPFVEQFTLGIVPAGSPPAHDAARPPAGSGPFMLAAMESGDRVVLQANADYWNGPPQLGGLIFRSVPDAMVRVLEFKKRAIDLMQNDIEPDMLPWLAKNTDADIGTHEGTTYQYIGINLTHPILRHVKVRQALACAIDRDRIIRHLLKGIATKANGLLAPSNWAHDGSVELWPHDPRRAKRLLDEAGFPDPDGDGPRPRFRLSFKTSHIDLRRRIAEAFKEQLQQVGIDLEVRSYEWATFFSDVKKGHFHLYSLAWVGVMDPDILYQIFHSASVPPNGDNRGRYRHAQVDRLLEEARRAGVRETRKLLYARAQRILAEDLPYVPLWWWKNVVVKRPAIRGFVPYPDGELVSLQKASWRPTPST
jgi:peptide/nickel transport system substrate-binding protein